MTAPDPDELDVALTLTIDGKEYDIVTDAATAAAIAGTHEVIEIREAP